MNFRSIITTTPLALALFACGGEVPGASQVRADIANPSGSISSKRTVAGAYVTRDAAGPAASIGAFNPGALTAQDLGAVSPARIMAPHFARLQAHVDGRRFQALEESPQSCLNNDEITQAMTASLMAGNTSGSWDVSLDLSSCASIGLSGKISMSGSYDISASGITYEIEEHLDNVCESSSGSCITGDAVLEMSVKAQQDMEMVMGWKLAVTEAGRSLTTKGGIRMAGLGGEGSEVEYVVYVNDESGNEVSMVIKLTNNSFSIRGKDGSLTCTIAADGSGSCDGNLSWDKAFVDALEADPTFNGSGK